VKLLLKIKRGLLGRVFFSQLVEMMENIVPKVRKISSRNLVYSFKALSELLTFDDFYILYFPYFSTLKVV